MKESVGQVARPEVESEPHSASDSLSGTDIEVSTRRAGSTTDSSGADEPSLTAYRGDSPQPDVRALMAEIRAKVLRDLASGALEGSWQLSRSSTEASADSEPTESGSLLYSEELNLINQKWHGWAEITEVSSHRKFLGRLIVKAKRFILDTVWQYCFRTYAEREREFLVTLVRHLNATARYIDARDKQLFWEIMKKIDADVQAINERTDLLVDEYRILHQRQLADLRKMIESLTTSR